PLLLVAIDSLLVEASPMPPRSDIHHHRRRPARPRCSSARADEASTPASLPQDRAIANHKIISTDNCHVWQPRGGGAGRYTGCSFVASRVSTTAGGNHGPRFCDSYERGAYLRSRRCN